MQRVKPTPGRAPGSWDEVAEAELETSIPAPAQDGGASLADRGREEAVGHSTQIWTCYIMSQSRKKSVKLRGIILDQHFLMSNV